MKQSTGKISNWRELLPLLEEDRHSEEEVRLFESRNQKRGHL
jgi:hypothetical protein